MPTRESPPRLNVEITQEQADRLGQCIPHGMKRQLFDVIIEDLLEILESDEGKNFLAAIIGRRLHLRELVKDG